MVSSSGLKPAPDNLPLRLKRGWALANERRYTEARTDFSRAVQLDPGSAEALAGVGYVLACEKAPAEAQQRAAEALLHGAGDYLVLHNVASIYARLAEDDNERRTAYEDTALGLLRRGVELWKQGRTSPSAIELMEAEPAFERLRRRREFQDLLQREAP